MYTCIYIEIIASIGNKYNYSLSATNALKFDKELVVAQLLEAANGSRAIKNKRISKGEFIATLNLS